VCQPQDYDFDSLPNRCGEGSIKWDAMKAAMSDIPSDATGETLADALAVSTADMDFFMAPEIVAALRESVGRRIYGYTWPTDNYYDAVIHWMQRRHYWQVEKESIALAPGIVAAIYYTLYAMTQPGDGVIIQPPVYAPFAISVRQTGRALMFNPLVNEGGRYTIDFDDLEAKASQKHAKMLLLCSPHNPVGRTWRRHELEQIADICLRYDVLILSDEIHFDIVFPPHKHTVFATLDRDLRDRCIVCTSPSKSFNIAGMQISNIIIGNRELREKFVQASLACGFHAPNCLAYDTCVAAYDNAEPWLEAMLTYIRANDSVTREYFAERKLPVGATTITISPLEATYLQWLDFSALGLDHRELQRLMREKAGVFFEEGYIFGDEGRGFERLNLAYPRSVIQEIARRVERVICEP